MLPDADVLAFRLHVPYADAFGHRGATHSILFAALLGCVAALAHRRLNATASNAGWFAGLATLSHPLLDACTNGGLGVALAWPFSDVRWFAPFHPIMVSPIGARFFSERGWNVIASELLWVWLPTAVLSLGVVAWRQASRRLQ
jgi:inner membrane protein